MNKNETQSSTPQAARKTSPFFHGWRILRRVSVVAGLIGLMAVWTQPPALADLNADHPRLLLRKQDIPALRAKLAHEPYASMLVKMDEISD